MCRAMYVNGAGPPNLSLLGHTGPGFNLTPTKTNVVFLGVGVSPTLPRTNGAANTKSIFSTE